MVESSRNGLLANWDHQRVLLTLSSRVSCLWKERLCQTVFCRLCDIHADTWTLKLYRPMFSSRGRRRISWRGAENRAQLKSFKATPVSLVIRIIMIMIQHFFSQPVNYIQAEVSCITVLQILVLIVEISKLSRYSIGYLIGNFWVVAEIWTWKVLAGMMILADLPAVRGTCVISL